MNERTEREPLTAEQIAANDVASMKEKRDWWKARALESADRCAWWEEREDALQKHIGINNELRKAAQVDNAALRDRLAAAAERERELREVGARFRDAAMLLASLTDYVEGEGISAQVWYQEFFWAISDIQECVTEIEPDYTDAALTILRRANERYPYRTRHHAALAPTDGAARGGDAAEGEHDGTER